MGKGASKAKAAEAPPPELPGALKEKLSAMFDRMDTNKDGTVDKSEAIAFWGKNFAKVNAGAMFNEVDMDKNGEMTKDEWLSFWQNVLKHGYSVRARTLRQQSRPRPYLPPLVSLADFFWRCLRAMCVRVRAFGLLQAEDVTEEVDSMMEGGSWVDWNDGRTT